MERVKGRQRVLWPRRKRNATVGRPVTETPLLTIPRPFRGPAQLLVNQNPVRLCVRKPCDSMAPHPRSTTTPSLRERHGYLAALPAQLLALREASLKEFGAPRSVGIGKAREPMHGAASLRTPRAAFAAT